jgi:hypothetical protein
MANLTTPYGVLSFANLFTPRPRAEGKDPDFNCSIIFDEQQQKSPAYKALKAAHDDAARAKWGDKLDLKTVRSAFHDAGEKTYDGYHPGHTYISPWTKNKPGIVDAQKQPVLLPDEVWSGQLVRINVTPFAWLHSGKKGVSFGLNHVQIVKSDGMQRLDGRPSIGSVFDEVEGDSGAPF